MIDIAKKFIELNPLIAISGSLGLNLQGIKTRRPPKDLDLFLPYGKELKLPEEVEDNGDEDGYDSRERNQYRVDGVSVDVFQVMNKYDVEPRVTTVDGLRVVNKIDIIQLKIPYVFGTSKTNLKHRDDITYILSTLPIESEE